MMDIQAIKLELMQLVLNTKKEKVLLQLKEIFEQENRQEASFRKEMVESAKKSNEDIKAGRIYTPEEVERRLEKRFGK